MPHDGGEWWVQPDGGRSGTYNSLGPVGHYSAGVCGLLATIGLLFFLYPMVVAVTSPLSMLSSTAIVTIGVSTWVVLWFLIEVIVDRRMT